MKEQVFASIGRLGRRPAAWIIYLGTAIQLIISAMVFLFDSGLPIWLVAAGWIVLILALGILALGEQQRSKHEAARQRREWKNLQTRKKILKERLSRNPDFLTLCSSCRHEGDTGDGCIVEASVSERNFQFNTRDIRGYCLLWDPKDSAGKQ